MRLKRLAGGAPPAPAALHQKDTEPPRRRGRFSYASHRKLPSRLYLREDGVDEPEAPARKRRLTSSTGRVELSDEGRVYVSDKKRRRVTALDDEGNPRATVFESANDRVVVQFFAVGRVVWVRDRKVVPVGTSSVAPDWVRRIACGEDECWRVTHEIPLPLTAVAMAANEGLLAITNEGHTLTAFQVFGDRLETLGTGGKGLTHVVEHDGAVLAVSHWEKADAWRVRARETAPAPVAKNRPLRVADLSEEHRSRITQLLRDSAIDAIHYARRTLEGNQERRRQAMQTAGEECWHTLQSSIRGDLLIDELDPSDAMMDELQRLFVDLFVDAADWVDED